MCHTRGSARTASTRSAYPTPGYARRTVETEGLVDRAEGLIATAGAGREGFARVVGLDRSTLSAALDGSRSFSSLDLALIADAHAVSVDWLLTGEPSVLMRAAHPPAGSARSLVERATDLSDRREGIVLLGVPHRWRPAEPLITGEPAEQGRALAAAALLRVRDVGRDVAEADLPGVVEDVFDLDVDENSDDPAGVRADCFARCFLMPQDVLVRATDGGLSDAGFVALVGALGTSPSLLAWRLMDLDLVDVEVGKRWGAMATGEAARTGGWGDELSDAMARALAPRAPRLLRHDLYRIYEAGGATLRPFADILGTRSDRLRQTLGSDLG